jgi:NitT/TauT family transport system ATP-binding protein
VTHIAAANLGKTFSARGGPVVAFDDLSFAIPRNEFFCIVGPSGCGKTTLLRCIANLERATRGTLSVNDVRQLAMVFQEQGLFPWMTLRDNVRFLMRNSARVERGEIDTICASLLDKVGLARFADLYPHQVSGGMRQRVSLIRSFAVHPDVLLMDEPFVFVDFQTKIVLHELLLRLWQDEGRTVVFVTHDIEEAVTLADRILVLSAHPGRAKAIVPVDLPRPRDVFDLRKSERFRAIVNEVMDLMRPDLRSAIETPT